MRRRIPDRWNNFGATTSDEQVALNEPWPALPLDPYPRFWIPRLLSFMRLCALRE